MGRAASAGLSQAELRLDRDSVCTHWRIQNFLRPRQLTQGISLEITNHFILLTFYLFIITTHPFILPRFVIVPIRYFDFAMEVHHGPLFRQQFSAPSAGFQCFASSANYSGQFTGGNARLRVSSILGGQHNTDRRHSPRDGELHGRGRPGEWNLHARGEGKSGKQAGSQPERRPSRGNTAEASWRLGGCERRAPSDGPPQLL